MAMHLSGIDITHIRWNWGGNVVGPDSGEMIGVFRDSLAQQIPDYGQLKPIETDRPDLDRNQKETAITICMKAVKCLSPTVITNTRIPTPVRVVVGSVSSAVEMRLHECVNAITGIWVCIEKKLVIFQFKENFSPYQENRRNTVLQLAKSYEPQPFLICCSSSYISESRINSLESSGNIQHAQYFRQARKNSETIGEWSALLHSAVFFRTYEYHHLVGEIIYDKKSKKMQAKFLNDLPIPCPVPAPQRCTACVRPLYSCYDVFSLAHPILRSLVITEMCSVSALAAFPPGILPLIESFVQND